MFALLIYVGYIALWVLLVFFASFISWKLFKSKAVTIIAGLVAFGVMYWPAFGDLIPTLLAHKQLCEKEAGFKVYVTPEQWDKENPGALDVLMPYEKFIVHNHVVMLNDRLGSEHNIYQIEGVAVKKSISTIVDTNDKKVLAQIIDFTRGYGSYGVGIDNRSVKMWLYKSSCFSNGENIHLLEGRIDFFKKFKIGN